MTRCKPIRVSPSSRPPRMPSHVMSASRRSCNGPRGPDRAARHSFLRGLRGRRERQRAPARGLDRVRRPGRTRRSGPAPRPSHCGVFRRRCRRVRRSARGARWAGAPRPPAPCWWDGVALTYLSVSSLLRMTNQSMPWAGTSSRPSRISSPWQSRGVGSSESLTKRERPARTLRAGRQCSSDVARTLVSRRRSRRERRRPGWRPANQPVRSVPCHRRRRH